MIEVITAFVTIASLTGTVANSYQKRWCFWVWLFTNAFWCGYNVWHGLYSQAVLYAVNFVFAVNGLVKWRKE